LAAPFVGFILAVFFTLDKNNLAAMCLYSPVFTFKIIPYILKISPSILKVIPSAISYDFKKYTKYKEFCRDYFMIFYFEK